MQRDDERLCQLGRKGKDVLAVGTAEDPVLVLEQYDVDCEPAQEAGGAHVIPSDFLRHRHQ